MEIKKKKLLIILDGWGHSNIIDNNAIAQANTPTWDKLNQQYLHSLIDTSGKSAGLPAGHMGNSEVGHLNIGAGRIVNQYFSRINEEIKNFKFFNNPLLTSLLKHTKRYKKAVHIMGMLSDGGVHSHEKHIHAMLDMAHRYGCIDVYLHIFTDGRDSYQKSAKKYIKSLEDKIGKLKIGKITSVVGRYFAMDRDNNWSRIRCAYELIVDSKADFLAKTAMQAIEMAYKRGETDEFIKPTIVHQVSIKKDDLIIFMNYRADRARQITQVFTDDNFKAFKRSNFIVKRFVCLTQYGDNLGLPVVYKPIELKNGLTQYLSNLGKTQLKIAETEKYAHVTFFFNGGVEKPFSLEKRILVKSPNVATYDLLPEMSAFEVTFKLVENIVKQKYDLIICNFANADMVGHSGNLSAAIKAVEAIDKCLSKIYEAMLKIDGEILITADHGNVEQMVYPETNKIHTSHTNNLVPLVFISRRKAKITNGNLADIAPTILYMMGIKPPVEMTGKSLLVFN